MTLIVWIIRVLLLSLIIRIIVSAFTTRAPRRQAAARGRTPRERLGGRLVRDPQCGTYVVESNAVTVGSGATATHFCSKSCRDAWLRAHGAQPAH
ncbi:MAG TPA: hypothetical protein VHD57_00900 [Vicinamibacterales bacterium]|nr:hypothetical protein [Vicinamibacterales bacterium]HWB17314.1 hypothetical protein [Vicinamibacterales bacterium]